MGLRFWRTPLWGYKLADTWKIIRNTPIEVVENPLFIEGFDPGGLPPGLQLAACKAAQQEITSWVEYDPTPLASLPKLAAKSGLGGLYVKDESTRFGLGAFKALGGAYAVFEAAKGKNPSELTFACTTAGNHGRAVAWGARRIGARTVVYLPAGTPQWKATGLTGLGADVRMFDGTYDEAVLAVEAIAQENGWVLIADTADNLAYAPAQQVIQGYSTMVDEILRDMPDGGGVTHIIAQGGVGSLAAGVIGYAHQVWPEPKPKMLVVEPLGAFCLGESARAGEMKTIKTPAKTVMAGLS